MTATPAHADSTNVPGGRIYMASTITADDSCTDLPVHWELPDVPVGYDWDLSLHSPELDSSAYGSGTGPNTGSDTATWCQSDLPGNFHLNGKFEVRNADYDLVASRDISLAFSVRLATPKATLKPGRTNPRVNQFFSLKGCVTVNGKRQTYKDIAIDYHFAGEGWHRYKRSYTDGLGCYKEDAYSATTGTLSLRTRVFSGGWYKNGYSKVVKVKVRKR